MSQSIGNPLIDQGTLNIARIGLQVSAFPQLNVTAPYLGSGGISLTPGGPATTFIPNLTGRTVAPEPYQPYTIGLHLVRSQLLAGLWEAQRVKLAYLGDILVFTDSLKLPSYSFAQCSIENIGDITSNGKSAEYMVTIGGTYVTNNDLFALVV